MKEIQVHRTTGGYSSELVSISSFVVRIKEIIGGYLFLAGP